MGSVGIHARLDGILDMERYQEAMTYPCHLCGQDAVVRCARCTNAMCERHAITVGQETLCARCARLQQDEYKEPVHGS